MRSLLMGMIAAGLMAGVSPVFAQSTQTVDVASATTKTVDGSISGDDFADYVVTAKAGQVLSVTLQSVDPAVTFNILPPGSLEALFIGSIYGTDFAGRMPVDGDYSIRVYQMGAAASDGLNNDFAMVIGLDVAALSELDDAVVEGTDFNATGALPCTFEANPDAWECDFGVKRQGRGVASVFITLPNGFVRQLDFAADGSVAAPGTDAQVDVVVEGEDTVVKLNEDEEVYRVKDIVVLGD